MHAQIPRQRHMFGNLGHSLKSGVWESSLLFSSILFKERKVLDLLFRCVSTMRDNPENTELTKCFKKAHGTHNQVQLIYVDYFNI
jgi:hypothetical protein